MNRIIKILKEKPDLIIRQVVLDKAQKEDQIIYGARAINQQVPEYLRKKTSDYDILTKKPKKTAKKVLEELKRRTGKEFTLKKAKHKGTYKIKYEDETVIDYTQLKRKPKTKSSFGNKYYDIKSIKKNISRSLNNPNNLFRKDKDLDSLNRINKSLNKFQLK